MEEGFTGRLLNWVSAGSGNPDLYSVYKENIEKIKGTFSTEITEANIDEIAPPV
jgi:hypothetical protein